MRLERYIAEFILSMEIPGERELREIKRAILNGLGTTIGACRHPSVMMLLELAEEISGKKQATILGSGIKTDVSYAALINGVQCHLFDFDDTHLDTIIHPTAPLLPVILALGEWKLYSGRELAEAFLAGMEVSIRIGESIYPSHYDKGWHITGTTGVIGAAAAAGRLLKLDSTQMVHAIGLAVQQSSGMKEMFGTMSKPFSPGKAARDGMFAALLAQKGFTSSIDSLSAKNGFFAMYSDEYNDSHIYDHLGKSFAILENSYKPYACGIVIHPIIDGMIEIRREHQLHDADIQSIEIQVHPLVIETTGKQKPKTGLEGKFSAYHGAAAGFLYGMVGEEQFSDEMVNNERVIALREKVILHVNPILKENESILTVQLKDGTLIEKHIPSASGSKEAPLTDEQLQVKFLQLTKDYIQPSNQESIIHMVNQFEEMENLLSLLRLSSGE